MNKYGSKCLAVVFAIVTLLISPAAFAERNPVELADGNSAHLDVLMNDEFPSATKCAMCHQKQFWEWASSNHAYASVSPMFHKFEQAVNALTDGTMGTFCTGTYNLLHSSLIRPPCVRLLHQGGCVYTQCTTQVQLRLSAK